ncbi:Domain of unknown function DUF927 [uncultured Caudovirales phage]|uniref:DUF927 domain-containing protein n=1 Tax=uncultured Caudovirales phage TaxID=2100421 RepID=A0A6J5LP46_9CAUD|nr:Domain of unknown function DUF927 [uncultured Caudovirales phage]
MNTLEFFQAILPAEGTYFLALFKPGFDAPAHKAFDSLESMAEAVFKIEQTNPTWSTYHACAAYNGAFIEKEGKKKYRVKDNWNKAKSFWADIDCGEDKASEGKGYATKREAAEALVAFCTKTGFPRPMFIDSGNGIHCYWPLSKAIRSEAWVRIAYALKSLFAHHGLLVDPSRTADFASILRPVGSYHKKSHPKEVVCKQIAVESDPREFANLVKELVQGIPVQQPPKPAPAISQEMLDANADLLGHVSSSISIPVSAIKVADRCNQVAEMRDMRGDVGYDQWRGVIGIIKHCLEGDTLAHEWSSGHEHYTYEATQSKLDTWSTPPATCEFFSKCNPKGCEGCTQKGKIKTPMVLGRVSEQQKDLVVEAEVDGEVMEVEIPEFPKGFRWLGDSMVREMEDKDDILHQFQFSRTLFYPLHRIRKEDGTFCLGMRVHLPTGKTRDFNIDTSLLASPQKLAEQLCDYEVATTNNKDSSLHMTAYLKDYLFKLMNEAEELNTLTTFGWHYDNQAFLVGDRLYHRDGTVRKVLVGGYAADKLSALPAPIGTSEGYAKALNFLYDRPGMQPMQYVIASHFGSLLTPFCDSMYHGLMMVVTGGDSGKGKTTVCNAALYAFGDAQKLQLSGEKGATMNARYSFMSAFKNIPVLMDELTSLPNDQLSELAYQISMGHEKERMRIKNTGMRFSESQTWDMSPSGTANADMHGKLAGMNQNSQAEAVRIIQIKIDQYPATKLEVEEVEPNRKMIELNRGAAGDKYIRYVVSNLDTIIEKLTVIGKRIHKDVPDSKYRFYRNHAMCSLAAIQITNELGITHFDFEKLYDYTVELFLQLAESVAENNTLTPEDALNNMIGELSPRIIVTTEYRDRNDGRGPETVRISGNTGPAGRYITGNANIKGNDLAGKLFICRQEFIKWCKDHRVDENAVIAYAQTAGLLVQWKEKFTIGRGSSITTGNTRCVVIDINKLQGMTSNAPKLTIHTSTPVQSGNTVVNI